MANAIKKLKAKGYKIGIFSNIDKDSLKWSSEKDKKNIEEGQKRGFKTHYYKSIKKFKEFIQELLNVKI